MHIRCPHCQNPIEMVCEDPTQDLTCPSCGSSFSLIDGSSTVSYSASARRRLGHFELLEQLGIGAFGSVWKARDTELDRVVAVKIPRKDQLSRGEMEQFFREARAAAQLRHPGIVSVHEVGREGETIYIVSDLIQGVTLSDWLSAHHLTPREAAELCLQVAQALHHAHAQGVIHRDLKPSNIMLDDAGRPHLMDFGLAKREAGEITMTVEGQLLGTPAYMSPEQARGEAHMVDRRADIYSLGVVLFQLLTGELPFRGTPRMLLHQVLYSEPRSPRSLNDRIPRDLETICLKAMAKEPGRRYESAKALANDLQRYLNGEPIQARPVGRMERGWRWCQRNRITASLGAGLAVALVGGMIASSYFAADAIASKNLAERQSVNALESAEKERAGRLEAERQYRMATAFRLAVQSREVFEAYPERSLLLAAEAVQINWKHRERHIAAAEQALRDSLDSFGRSILLRHDGKVNSVDVSSDGHWLASAGKDKTVRLWDLTAKDPAHAPKILTGHESDVLELKFSADTRWLAAGSADKTVRLWDLKATEPSTRPLLLPGYSEDDDALAFSQDSRWLGTRFDETTLRLLDLTSRDPASAPILLKGDDSPFARILFSPDGTWLVTEAFDRSSEQPKKRIQVWNLTSENISESSAVINEEFTGVGLTRISSDSRWLVVTNQGRILLWRLDVADPASSLVSLQGHEDSIHWSDISPDSRWIATASIGNAAQIRLFRLSDNQPMTPSTVVDAGPENTFINLSFSPDSRRLLVSTTTQGIVTCDLTADPPTMVGQSFPDLSFLVRKNWVSPNGRWLVARHKDSSTRLCDLTVADPVATSIVLRGFDEDVSTVAWDRRHRWLVTMAYDEPSLRLWDLTDPNLETSADVFPAGRDMVPMAVSRNGRWLVASDGQRAQLHDLAATNPDKATYILDSMSNSPSHWTMSGDWRWLAAVTDNNVVKLWDLDSDSPVRNTRVLRALNAKITQITLNFDGRWVASSSFDEVVHVWDTMNLNANAATYLFAEQQLVSISPDGKWLLTHSGKSGESVILWNLTLPDPTAKPVTQSDPEKIGILGRFSPDSRWLATFGSDDSLRVWHLLDSHRITKKLELAAGTLFGSELFSRDGRWLLTAGDDGIHLRDLNASNSSQPAMVLKRGSGPLIFPKQVSPDSRWLLSQTAAEAISLWDLSAKPGSIKPQILHTSQSSFEIGWAFFSPNCRWLVHDTGDRQSLWDLTATNPEASRVVLRGTAGLSAAMGLGVSQPFTPDGRWLIGRTENKYLRRWNLRIEDLVPIAQKVAGRTLTDDERALYAIPD